MQLLFRILLGTAWLLALPINASAAYDWPAINLVAVTPNLPSPVHIANAGDGSGRLFIVQQGGTIRVIKNGSLLGTPFLDLSSRISCCGERGLLSVAFPPAYASKGYFYVYYTDAAAGSVTLARYFVSANPDIANFNSEQILLSIPHASFSNHNGGQLAFGPDGYLYMGPGDGGGGGDTLGNGQNHGALLGKILRLDVESSVIPYPTPTPAGNPPYLIPPSNPYVSTAGYRPEIWALGMRNPFRFSFDRQTGDLYIADVGQDTYEEVDYQPAASSGGQNYGWNIMEGFHCYSATSCNSTGLTLPVIEYDHSLGCSITGGFVYRGAQFARMNGVYFYGDYCSGRIWGAVLQGGTWLTNLLYDAPFNITSFGEDQAANLYVTDYTNGVIYQLIDTQSPTATPTPIVIPTTTKTPAQTPTLNTPTQTATFTNTASRTPTNTPTQTPTFTNTPTKTPTATNTPTQTFTFTNTPTQTATFTNTASRTPTPTNTAIAAAVHVGDLDGTSANLGKGWQATVTIAVHDTAHSPVAGATVSGAWSGGAAAAGSCITAADGRCSVTSPLIPKKNGSVIWTVNIVGSSGRVYQPGSNHDPDGDSNGTVITVRK